MKKLTITAMLAICWLAADAQTYDTLESRCRHYYYSQWYDTCACGYDSCVCDEVLPFYEMKMLAVSNSYRTEYAFSDYAPRPLEVLGVALMVDMEPHSSHYFDSNYTTEYAYLAYYDSALNQMRLLDSARWDTVVPHVLKLRLTARPETYYQNYIWPGGIAYCLVYEAYFEKPVTVDSVFWIIGTLNSNARLEEPWNSFYAHRPISYSSVRPITNSGLCPCKPLNPPKMALWRSWHPEDTPLNGMWRDDRTGKIFGPFLPIIRPQSLVTVLTADSAMGTVRGGGYYLDSTLVRLEAEPRYGYVFSHWGDGDTTNPRMVLVEGDTTFTAHFADAPFHRLRGDAYPPEGGRVRGAGNYPEGTEVRLTAEAANSRYSFLEWDDHDTANPRMVRVERDTLFTAVFVAGVDTGRVGIAPVGGATFTLQPNPTDGEVRVETAGDAFPGGVLAVTDASGREVQRHELAPHTGSVRLDLSALPQGTYFVTLRTEEGSSTKKLVLK